MKTLIVLALLAIVAALAGGGLFMLRKRSTDASGRDSRMAWALAMRVGLSVCLFLFVLFSYWMGWIRPTGIPTGH
ncbi:twin transmembrane helix small protein [Ideonella paludis]|uniref:Twin transmembrane helix small protein n=1 Tax=Ideonella paludis TaxID=1233411 RepID=A0ABS5DWN8_9BURK|nr:twin transmembrane helix small protein [Ideonella paludis]MBQ0935561.1 twin transmembrane helix small protein [Ideonella paludis]